MGNNSEDWEKSPEDTEQTDNRKELNTEDDWEFDDISYGESDDGEEYEDDFEDDGNIVIRFKPWMIPAFAGMMILAILICIPLWKLSRHDSNTENNGIAAVTTENQTTEVVSAEVSETGTVAEASDKQETTPGPETAATESAAIPTESPTTAPAATPETQIQPTELPTPTELPAAGNTGNALAEGNSMTFGDVNETVTAKNETNLRSEPYTGDAGNVVGQLKNGETLPRTGRNDSTGWSRLEYNGQTVYAVTAYLTTDLSYKTPEKPSNPNRVSTQDGRVIVFTDCDDYITPKELINLRTEPSTSEGESTVRTQVKNGTNLHRTGYSEGSGWSRVEYNGEILYAVTNYVISGSAPE